MTGENHPTRWPDSVATGVCAAKETRGNARSVNLKNFPGEVFSWQFGNGFGGETQVSSSEARTTCGPNPTVVFWWWFGGGLVVVW
jgi:hypothetical protein